MATSQYKAWSVVIMSTMAFTVCFMIWMMFAVIGIPISRLSVSTKPSSASWLRCLS